MIQFRIQMWFQDGNFTFLSWFLKKKRDFGPPATILFHLSGRCCAPSMWPLLNCLLNDLLFTVTTTYCMLCSIITLISCKQCNGNEIFNEKSTKQILLVKYSGVFLEVARLLIICIILWERLFIFLIFIVIE